MLIINGFTVVICKPLLEKFSTFLLHVSPFGNGEVESVLMAILEQETVYEIHSQKLSKDAITFCQLEQKRTCFMCTLNCRLVQFQVSAYLRCIGFDI